MAGRKSTIYDIAEKSRTSASTVAAVLNGTWEKRRVSAKTAKLVQKTAAELSYRTNLQASGLRTSKSGMVGMVLPLHDNRYFSSLAQHFEEEARKRNLCPVVVSTLRDPDMEIETVQTLIAHNIDQLFIAGATAPDQVGSLCSDSGIAHINVDLPGSQCRSVISDNYWGATQLSRHLLGRVSNSIVNAYFVGGIKSDFNTAERARAFKDVIGKNIADIETCGYGADDAEAAIAARVKSKGRLPDILFINSTIAFEGVFRFLKTQSETELNRVAIGCYDWDPFLAHLHFPVAMVRQDAGAMIKRAYELIDNNQHTRPGVDFIQPILEFGST
jgi:LacI family transcriptional regulator, fructose operon transcriptional repressor